MTDDWSLKGKEERPICSAMYRWADIEILRLKLIEDIKEMAMKAGNEICWQDCRTIINDRFGHDSSKDYIDIEMEASERVAREIDD